MSLILLLLFAFVPVLMDGRIHRRYLSRLEAACAQRGLSAPLPPPPLLKDKWFVFRPHAGDPPDLAEEKAQMLQEIGAQKRRIYLFCLPLLIGFLAYELFYMIRGW